MSINLELQITGNPFVDSGIFAMTSRLKKNIEEITISDFEELTKEISKLYTEDNWQKNMYSIFPNSELTKPSTAKLNNVDELYFNVLKQFIDNIGSKSEEGTCIACGVRNSLKSYTKTFIPLTGSGSLKNYFSFANDGADYCPLCVLLIQFSPLVMYRSGGKMILLHSNSEKVMKYWAKKAIDNLKTQYVKNDFTGCFNEGFTNPNNAIFRMINNIIRSYDERWVDENPSLNFYYFTNFNQGPELDLFNVPTNVFRFLAYIPQDEYSNWNLIVKNAYKFVKWDKVESIDDYKNNPNEVYNRLLKNSSILRFFFNVKNKKAYCSWNLLRYYMMEVRNMEDKRLNAIKDLGDKLSKYIENNNEKSVLTKLETASNYNSFRNILRKIIKKRIAKNEEELLFTFDEYVNYLFPQGNLTWRETQDLLLFRIYENLHQWLIDNNYVDELEIEEIESEEIEMEE